MMKKIIILLLSFASVGVNYSQTNLSFSGAGDLQMPLGKYQIGTAIEIICRADGYFAEMGGIYHIASNWSGVPTVVYRGESGQMNERLKFHSYVDPGNGSYMYLFATWVNLSPSKATSNTVSFTITTKGTIDINSTGSFSSASEIPSVLTVNSSYQNVSIGTTDPRTYRLAVAGGDIKSYNYDNNSGISIGAEATQRPRIGFHVSDNNRRFKIELNGINSVSERLGIFTNNGGASPETEVFSITKTGNVAIGTTDPLDYKLAVNGNAIFNKVKVKLYPWADYVFYDNYKLPTLKEVEEYIKQYRHLPGVPSEKEIQQNGLDVGDSQATLLGKIEELTLYLVDFNKKMEQLQQENLELKKLIKNQSK